MSDKFVATVKGLEQLENGDYTDKMVQIATQEFETLTEACNYCEMEAHGIKGADWTVAAKLSFKKACSTVAASRNRKLFLYMQLDALNAGGDHLPLQSSVELKAPQICKVLHEMEKRVHPEYEPEKCTVRLLVTKDHMIAG
jgi:hypothetical protein